MDEIKAWLNKASEDLSAANWNFKGRFFAEASFLCQQAVEKAFKALLLKSSGEIIKTHDLVFLSKSVNAPEKYVNYSKELTQAYIYSRYPDVKAVKNLEEIASKFLNWADEILKWAETQI